MTVTEDEIKMIGKLSRIAIEKKDLDTYVSQMNRILDLVSQLNTADTEDIPPMSHPLDLKARLREDKVVEDISVEDKMKSSSNVEDSLYIVPKVID